MTEITVDAVKSLRDRTGAGMMDCKKALEEAEGDEERAIDLLRKKGAATAARRADRETSEGRIAVARDESTGAAAMVEATSETDFVARNEEFVAFAERAARRALEAELAEGEVQEGETLFEGPGGEELRDRLNGLRAKIGENLRLGRLVRYEPAGDAVVESYIHFGDRIGVLVELVGAGGDGDDAREVAREIAMHVAATDPIGVSEDDIPEEERERERRLLEEQAAEEGKPEHIVEQIVEGRMRKFYEQQALLRQGFVKEPETTVEEHLERAGSGLAVRRFIRFEIGG